MNIQEQVSSIDSNKDSEKIFVNYDNNLVNDSSSNIKYHTLLPIEIELRFIFHRRNSIQSSVSPIKVAFGSFVFTVISVTIGALGVCLASPKQRK